MQDSNNKNNPTLDIVSFLHCIGILEELDEIATDVGYRAAQLYRSNIEEYDRKLEADRSVQEKKQAMQQEGIAGILTLSI